MGEGTCTHRAWGAVRRYLPQKIEAYTREITSNCSHATNSSAAAIPVARVPKCGTGRMRSTARWYAATTRSAGFVFRLKAGRTLSDDEIKDLLTDRAPSYSKASKRQAGQELRCHSRLRRGIITRRSCSLKRNVPPIRKGNNH